MNPLTDFIQQTLYPQLFERVDMAFPEMGFSRRGRNWQSRKKLDGSISDRPDKCVITASHPNRILEQGGDTKDLLTLFMERNGHTSTFEGVEAICKAIGITPPERQSSEEWEKFKAQLEKREQLYKQMEEAIFTEEGAAVLNYLRTTRGYSDELIRKMGIVCITKAAADAMEDAPRGIETLWPMAIPYWSGGRLYGFKFRAIDPDTKPKYKNSFKLPKEAKLFGLTGINLSGDRDKDRTITIVEGELDALHAQAAGMDNICAAAGGSISPEQMAEAKRRGVKRVILLFDTEATEESQRNTDKKILAALRVIHQAGLKGYVATLPSSEGVKTDVDSYLNTHTKEELEAVVEQMEGAAIYLCRMAEVKALEKYKAQEGEVWSQTNIDDFKDEIIALANSSITDPTDRPTIFQMASEFSQGAVTRETLQERADALKAISDRKRLEEETKKLAEDISLLAKSGQTEKALAAMAEALPHLQEQNKESEYSNLLQIQTEAEVLRSLQNRPQGIPTNYAFGQGNKAERLIIPSGAITFVCAPTSHGKSTLLQNLALQIAGNQMEGAVLYFTFEEDAESVKLQMMNKAINQNFSKTGNNLRILQSYFRDGEGYFVNGTKEEVLAKGMRFVRDYLTSGKLRIFYKDWDSTELIGAIRYLSKTIKVKAVFVDYVQLLKKHRCRLQRTEEVKEICNDLKKLVVDTGLPLIMAAQLNRETKSPLEMHNQNIAEAADIERIANTIVCLWNSDFDTLNKSTITPEQRKWLKEQCGITLGEGGKIFAKLTKNRGGAVGLNVTLDYCGNTGVITDPNPERADHKESHQSQPQASAPDTRGAATIFTSTSGEDLPF